MCLDSEIHTCTEVKFIQELRVGGLLHSNHLILTNEDSTTAELWNIKLTMQKSVSKPDISHITLFYKISCSCKGWNCPWFKSRLCLMKRFWVTLARVRAVTNPGKYKICSPTNLIWYPTKEHGMSVLSISWPRDIYNISTIYIFSLPRQEK